MNVAVFGATGRTGSLVVQALLDRGHGVVSVSRSSPNRRFEGRYESRVGDVSDPAFLASVLAACDGSIFCIGQNLKSPKNLFSQNLSPADIRTQVVTAILRGIADAAARRFVYLSAFGVGEDLKKHAFIFRMVLRLSSLGASFEDHRQAEVLVRASKTDWTIVRPPGLTEKDEVVPLVDARGKWTSFMTVSRKSLAQYLVHTLECSNMNRQTLTVIEAKMPQKD